MEAQQQGQQSDKQPVQVSKSKLPRWVRPVAITVAVICFAIGGVIWIRGVHNDLEKVMTAIFAVLSVVCAFFAIPFLYAPKDTESSVAKTTASPQPSIIVTVSPSINVSPNQNMSQQPAPTDTKAHDNAAEAPQSTATTNIQRGQKPIPCEEDAVFLVNTSLTDPNEFYGRKRECTQLLSRTRKGGCTSIVGPRRIGKTWLLSYLRLVTPTRFGSNFHIGYLDVTIPSCATVAGFTTEALKVLGSPLFSIPTNPGLTTLEGFVKDMVAKNQTPILCIDEFEGFTQRQDFDLNFFTELRAITQAGLGLVVASKEPLIDIVSENVKTSPFFNVFLQLRLAPFDTQDAEKFAQAKSIQAGFSDQERADLLKYGQRGEQQWPPLRLQMVGEILLEDKILATQEGLHYYRPSDPDYWLEFKERLEERYQAVVKK